MAKKGGEGATTGRKSETIHADINGVRFSKRVFFGQRFLAVCEVEGMPFPIVTAWHTQEEAARMDAEYEQCGYPFHGWAAAYTN